MHYGKTESIGFRSTEITVECNQGKSLYQSLFEFQSERHCHELVATLKLSGFCQVGSQLLSKVAFSSMLYPYDSSVCTFFCYFTEVASSASSRRTHFIQGS